MLNFLRLICFLGFTALLIPVQALALAIGWRLGKTLPMSYHRGVCRIFGFRIETHGQMSAQQPTLFIVNHMSYIDIEILGAILPGSFVAKSEVASWPLFGLLAKLQRTVFVDRRRGTSAKQRDSLVERLNARENIILFPEGTSSDGNRLIPFKSALFSAAEIRVDGAPVHVQPVTLAYVRLGGIPMGRTHRPFFAWYGDMELASHMWRVLGMEPLTASIQFHPVVTIDQFGSRKKLSEYCERIIAESLAAANSGRLQPAPQPLLQGEQLKPSMTGSGTNPSLTLPATAAH